MHTRLLPGINSTSSHPARSIAVRNQRYTDGSEPSWRSVQVKKRDPHQRPSRYSTQPVINSREKPMIEYAHGLMNGTVPNRLRLRELSASSSSGRSSTQAGPMLEPNVPV